MAHEMRAHIVATLRVGSYNIYNTTARYEQGAKPALRLMHEVGTQAHSLVLRSRRNMNMQFLHPGHPLTEPHINHALRHLHACSLCTPLPQSNARVH
jgi:hypothetical protein